MNEKSLFEQLQYILLEQDRKRNRQMADKVEDIQSEVSDLKEEVQEIKEDVSGLKEGLEDPEKFEQKVDPYVKNRITDLKVNFQHYFGHEVKETIKTELEHSRDDFIEALYPIIGQVVRRYVKYSFDGFLENVNHRMSSAFSPKRWANRVRAVFAGVSGDELLIQESIAQAKIEEAFVIHMDSGLLIGSYSSNNTTDLDMIAGMLTAIKSFVKDAFQAKDQGELETIEYGNYRILINHFHKYYVATVLSGMVDAKLKERLDVHFMEFSKKHIPDTIGDIDDRLFSSVSNKLKKSIQDFEKSTK